MRSRGNVAVKSCPISPPVLGRDQPVGRAQARVGPRGQQRRRVKTRPLVSSSFRFVLFYPPSCFLALLHLLRIRFIPIGLGLFPVVFISFPPFRQASFRIVLRPLLLLVSLAYFFFHLHRPITIYSLPLSLFCVCVCSPRILRSSHFRGLRSLPLRFVPLLSLSCSCKREKAAATQNEESRT